MSVLGSNNLGFGGNFTGGNAIKGSPCGSFFDLTIQTANSPNTGYAMKLGSTDSSATTGVSIENNTLGDPTRIKVSQAGVYNLAFSSQIHRNSGGTKETVNIWLRKNDSGASGNLENTNTKVDIQNNTLYVVAAWNFFVNLNENDYLEIMWATSSTGIELLFEVANGVHPATPSVIATINRVS